MERDFYLCICLLFFKKVMFFYVKEEKDKNKREEREKRSEKYEMREMNEKRKYRYIIERINFLIFDYESSIRNLYFFDFI